MKVTVIGSGTWGTSLAQVLSDNGHECLMWTHSTESMNEINNNHTNSIYFKDLVLPENIKATTDLKEAIEYSDMIILVVATKFIRETLQKINDLCNSPKVFVNASKGLEPGTHERVSEIISEVIDEENRRGIAILTGPTHAEEVIIRMVTTIVSVSNDDDIAKEVQELFSNSYFRVYRANDLLGSEIASSLKNVIALASGVISGLGYGDNTRAALITRGLAEMIRFGLAMGAKVETFYGLTGIGDLIVTATSTHSRNFNAGFKVGQGLKVSDVLNESFMVVEGVRTAKAVYEMLDKLNIEMPITQAVYEIFYDEADPKLKLEELMNRELKAEN